MANVCLYFQVHQPYRLKDYSFFKIGTDHNYGYTQQNYAILQRVGDACYCPANELILKLIERTKGELKVSYSISGTCLEQLAQFRPDVIESFVKLGQTGCVEFLAETQYHSLAYLYSKQELLRQIDLHRAKIKELFGQTPTTFRNTELIYDNGLPNAVAALGFTSILAEGVDRYLGTAPAGALAKTVGADMLCLRRNYGLSDDVAFRFTDSSWSEYPLTPEKYAGWVQKAITAGSETVNVFMDYETFGEHRRKESGIFEFLEDLPAAILKAGIGFTTPARLAAGLGREAVATLPVYDVPETTSWADAERTTAAWNADNMQRDALRRCYAIEADVHKTGDATMLEVWGRLQTSDHFYYMSTKFWKDPAHAAFSPYKSPYDAYINYMNVLTDFTQLVRGQ